MRFGASTARRSHVADRVGPRVALGIPLVAALIITILAASLKAGESVHQT
jgi:hypothetical protein